MKSLLAFIRKEWTEHLRSGRVLIFGILFLFFGIMSPAIARLTPALIEMMADSLAGSGIAFTGVTITAMDSWVQFFKNMPIALIVFILLESSIFTREYRSGTLLLSLTKGLERWKIVAAKTVIPVLLWTACYWLCFGVTYGYTGYFWDNAVAQNLLFSAGCWWLFGLWAVMLMVFFSAVSASNTGVLAGQCQQIPAHPADGWKFPYLRHGKARNIYPVPGHYRRHSGSLLYCQHSRFQPEAAVISC